MNYTVRFTPGPRKDLRAIFDYISESDTPQKAQYVIEQIVETALALKKLPLRGTYLPELLDFGIRGYRQVFFKPYRVIYTVRESSILIAIVADGRRDLQSLVAMRLLGS